MADHSKSSQEEVEALLKKAQAEASGEDAPPDDEAGEDAAKPASTDALGQDEVEALVQSAGKTPQVEPAAAESTTAAALAAAEAAGVLEEGQELAQGDVELLLNQAQAALASVDQPADSPAGVQPFQLPSLAGAPPSTERTTLQLIRDVELDLKIELGRTHMALEDVLRLRKGSVVPLDKLAGDPVDIYVNGRLIARGEVLVLNDNFCVRVAELIAGEGAA